MRIVLTSDLHGDLPVEFPEGDLLLIAGDICPVWDHRLEYQEEWLATTWQDWLKDKPEAVITPGNHDFIFEHNPKIGENLLGTYLINETKTINGLKIHGSPWSNKFGNWAYMAKEPELRDKFQLIPRDIDILMVHGPAWGYGDQVDGFSMTKRGMVEKQHVGSTSLTNMLIYEDWPNLKLFVFGHIHEGYGEYSIGDVRLFNVAHMDDEYRPNNPPVVIDIG